MSRWIWLSVAAMFLVGASGCGRTATVKGKVTFQGRPVTHGSVILLSSDGKARSGVIESDGSYSVGNVPAGDLKIGVISRNPSKGRTELPGHEGKIDKGAIKTWFPLPQQYEDPDKSGLVCTVTSGRVDHEIALK